MGHPIRVASVPDDSLYVRHISWKGDGVKRIAAEFDPIWIEDNRRDFDLFHLHSGYEDPSRERVLESIASLDRLGVPLVYTVHELKPSPVRELQTLLLSAADMVISLSDELRARIFLDEGRNSRIVPHPHVVPLDGIENTSPRRRLPPFTIGVQLDSLAPDVFAESVVEAVAERVRESACFRARVDVQRRDDGIDPGALAPLLAGLERRGQIELHFHERFDDESLVECARRIDIAIAPSASGPHARWLEAFRDLGSAVVVPTVGSHTDPRGSFSFRLHPTGVPDRNDLRNALEAAEGALTAGEIHPLAAEKRRRQRRLIAERHRWIYREAIRKTTGRSTGPEVGERRLDVGGAGGD